MTSKNTNSKLGFATFLLGKSGCIWCSGLRAKMLRLRKVVRKRYTKRTFLNIGKPGWVGEFENGSGKHWRESMESMKSRAISLVVCILRTTVDTFNLPTVRSTVAVKKFRWFSEPPCRKFTRNGRAFCYVCEVTTRSNWFCLN